jgi:hypothetical protein
VGISSGGLIKEFEIPQTGTTFAPPPPQASGSPELRVRPQPPVPTGMSEPLRHLAATANGKVWAAGTYLLACYDRSVAPSAPQYCQTLACPDVINAFAVLPSPVLSTAVAGGVMDVALACQDGMLRFASATAPATDGSGSGGLSIYAELAFDAPVTAVAAIDLPFLAGIGSPAVAAFAQAAPSSSGGGGGLGGGRAGSGAIRHVMYGCADGSVGLVLVTSSGVHKGWAFTCAASRTAQKAAGETAVAPAATGSAPGSVVETVVLADKDTGAKAAAASADSAESAAAGAVSEGAADPGAQVTALAVADFTGRGHPDLLVARDDGRLEVYALDLTTALNASAAAVSSFRPAAATPNPATGNAVAPPLPPPPRLIGSAHIGESIRAVAAGPVASPSFCEAVVLTYTGKLLSFTPESLAARDPTDLGGRSRAAVESDARASTLKRDIDSLRRRIAEQQDRITRSGLATPEEMAAVALKLSDAVAASSGSGSGLASAASALTVNSTVALDPRDGSYRLGLEIPGLIGYVVLQSTVPIEILDPGADGGAADGVAAGGAWTTLVSLGASPVFAGVLGAAGAAASGATGTRMDASVGAADPFGVVPPPFSTYFDIHRGKARSPLETAVAAAAQGDINDDLGLGIDTATDVAVAASQASLDLLAAKASSSILCLSPLAGGAGGPYAPQGTAVLATLRCQESTNRVVVRFRMIEGQAGAVTAIVTERASGASLGRRAGTVVVPVRSLSLHQRRAVAPLVVEKQLQEAWDVYRAAVDTGVSKVRETKQPLFTHSRPEVASAAHADADPDATEKTASPETLDMLPALPQKFPFITLVLSGPFSLLQMHEWVCSCLPDVPAKLAADGREEVQLSFRGLVLSTHLLMNYRKGSAVFKSDSPSAISVLREHMTTAATALRMHVESSVEVPPYSLRHLFAAAKGKLLYTLLLQRKVGLVEAVKEIVASAGKPGEAPSGPGKVPAWLSEDMRDILLRGATYQREAKAQPQMLQQITGIVVDAFVDFHRLSTGREVLPNVADLVQLLPRALEPGSVPEIVRFLERP